MNNLSWLIGLLEGEGSFYLSKDKSRFRPSVYLAMTDKDVVEAAAKLMDCHSVHTRKSRKINWSESYEFVIRGEKAKRLMGEIYSCMGMRRQHKISEILGYFPNTAFDLDSYQWLIGILEGEGSFIAGPPSEPNYPRVQFSTTDHDIAIRVANLLSVSCSGPYQRSNQKAKPAYAVKLRGKRAVDLMNEMSPFMSERRQKQIQKAIETYVYRPGYGETHSHAKLTEDQVRYIREALANGTSTVESLAQEFGVVGRTIRGIRLGKAWQHLKD